MKIECWSDNTSTGICEWHRNHTTILNPIKVTIQANKENIKIK